MQRGTRVRKDPSTLAGQNSSKRCSYLAETRFTAVVFGKISEMHTSYMVYDIDVTCRIVVNQCAFRFVFKDNTFIKLFVS